MSDNFELIHSKNDDVLSIRDAILKASKVKEALNRASVSPTIGSAFSSALNSSGLSIRWKREDYENWLKNGVSCEILKLGFQR